MRWLLVLCLVGCGCGEPMCEGRVLNACRDACSADRALPVDPGCLAQCSSAALGRCQLAFKSR